MATTNPIDAYLADLEHPQAKATLGTLRAQLRKLLPSATETISYGMPAYRMENGKVAAGFAFSGRNCGYYPHSGNIVARLGPMLEGYKTSPGAVSFPPNRQLPLKIVKALVKERLAEIADDTASQPKPPARRRRSAGAAKTATATGGRRSRPGSRR